MKRGPAVGSHHAHGMGASGAAIGDLLLAEASEHDMTRLREAAGLAAAWTPLLKPERQLRRKATAERLQPSLRDPGVVASVAGSGAHAPASAQKDEPPEVNRMARRES